MKKISGEVDTNRFVVKKETKIVLEDKTVILEAGDQIIFREIEKYESSFFDPEFYKILETQVKKWGQHFEYRMGIHIGFIVKDLMREGVRFNLTDSVEPLITGYKGSFEI